MKLPLRYELDAAGDVGLYDAEGTILGWGFKPADARALCRAANAAAGLAEALVALLGRMGNITMAQTPEGKRARAALAAYKESP